MTKYELNEGSDDDDDPLFFNTDLSDINLNDSSAPSRRSHTTVLNRRASIINHLFEFRRSQSLNLDQNKAKAKSVWVLLEFEFITGDKTGHKEDIKTNMK